MSRLAYLGGSVGTLPGQPRWARIRRHIELDLIGAGYDVYRPDLAFADGPSRDGLYPVHDAVIDRTQAGVVQVPVSTWPHPRTIHEVGRMLDRGIPVLVVCDVAESAEVVEWVRRGALLVHPDDKDEVAASLAQLAHRAADREPKVSLGQAMRQMAETWRQACGPIPLVFEPVNAGCEHVLTPTGPQHLLPSRSYADDAGLDLYVSADVEIGPYDFCDIPCGVKVDVPAGHWGLITGRSSTLRRRRLLVNPGVIDAGWTGELFAGVQNLSGDTVRVEAGDRLAQLILLPAPVIGRDPQWGRVPEKERGEQGFGSTGA